MKTSQIFIACLAFICSPGVVAEEPVKPEPGPVPAMPAPEAADYRLLDITVAGDRAVVVGQHGVILTSADGETWTQSPVPVSTMLTGVQFTDAQTGWVTGYDGSILKSADGGQSWAIKHYDITSRPLFDLLFIDDQRGIAVGGYGTQYVTADGGESWLEVENALTDAGMHLNEILHLPDGTLFIAGERGLLARSVDQGATWEILQSPYKGSFFGAMHWGEAGVLLHGMRGHVFLVEDVAALKVAETLDWDIFSDNVEVDEAEAISLGYQPVTNPSKESLFGGMIMEGQAMLVGVNGSILKLNTGAHALTPVASDIDQTLAGVTRFKGLILAVGRRGVQRIGESQ